MTAVVISTLGAVAAPEKALDMLCAPARDTHFNDSSSDQHKSSVLDTHGLASRLGVRHAALVLMPWQGLLSEENLPWLSLESCHHQQTG